MMLKTKEEMIAWLDLMEIENYHIHDDLTVDVDGHVYLSRKKLKEIPVQFNNVTGYFVCDKNELVSLKGCPRIVGTDFVCSENQLTSLEGGPQEVGADYSCFKNQLNTLKGSAKLIKGSFDAGFNKLKDLECCPTPQQSLLLYDNKLESLKGCPSILHGNFNCSDNELLSLMSGPSEIKGDFHCDNNPLLSLSITPLKVHRDFHCCNNKLENITESVLTKLDVKQSIYSTNIWNQELSGHYKQDTSGKYVIEGSTLSEYFKRKIFSEQLSQELNENNSQDNKPKL